MKVLYSERFVGTHANCADMYVYGFAHREVCSNTCKLWRYVCIQVLYTERFVVIHANCGDMYVYGFCTQRGLW